MSLFKNILLMGGMLLALGSCREKPSETTDAPRDLKAIADSLAHAIIITDGHVDLPYRMKIQNFQLTKEYIDVSKRTSEGDFDYVRAREGGLDAPFMSIYIPSRLQVTGGAKDLADSLITMIEDLAKAHPDKFAMAYSPREVEKNFAEGKLSFPMGMENGAPIENDLANVAYFHQRGIRYITLTHATDNQICDSSYDNKNTWNGLSPFGEEVVKEMNRVGIMVDVSHISDSSFYDVMDLTEVPVVASHSSCRKFTPGFQRNMSDDMLRRLKENNGVIQINFGSSFLDSTIPEQNAVLRRQLDSLLNSRGVTAEDSIGELIVKEFQAENPKLYADVETVVKHIDHVVDIAGIDHVGLGSDFDGVGDSLPTGLKDVSNYPNLIYLLLQRGYSTEDVEKICYKNVWRVWNAVEAYATSAN